jgi:hypothetical protein
MATLQHFLLKNANWNLKHSTCNWQCRGYLNTWANTWFELRHMEHRVHSASNWQVDLVGHLANAINHTKRPEELEGEFVIHTLGNRSLYVWLEVEKYLVPHKEHALAPVFVSLNFHTLLHTKKMLANGSDY